MGERQLSNPVSFFTRENGIAANCCNQKKDRAIFLSHIDRKAAKAQARFVFHYDLCCCWRQVFLVVSEMKSRHITIDEAAQYDAILIPGGGSQRTVDPASLPPWTVSRLDAALSLFRAGYQGYFLTLSGGTTHVPNFLDSDGFPVFEAMSAAQYLMLYGVPAGRIVREYASYDTIGNAYFARVQHTDPAGWRKLLVITSDFHMPRTSAIFQWVFGLDESSEYSLDFLSVLDVGLDADALAARRDREQASLQSLGPKIERLQTMRALHRWLYSEHTAYATQPHIARPVLDPALARSY
jgi:uncharacterized SAM-binding protein YcdF (DUF218 family)